MSGCGKWIFRKHELISRSSPGAVLFIILFRVAGGQMPREGWESNHLISTDTSRTTSPDFIPETSHPRPPAYMQQHSTAVLGAYEAEVARLQLKLRSPPPAFQTSSQQQGGHEGRVGGPEA